MALRRALAVGTGGGYEQIPDADTIRVSRIGALSGTGPASVVLENAAGNTATLSGGALTLGSGVALAAGGASPALSGFGTATFNTKVVTPEVESSGNLTLDAASGSNTTITMENSGAGALSVAIGGDMVVTGNLTVTGVMTTTGTASTSFTDNHLYLNAGYETAVAQTGGLVANYLPLSTNDTVAATGFVAGVAAVSNPTVKTAGSATFAVGQLIQIAGANNAANNGLFEVLSHVTTTLTIRGVGTTTTVEDFTDNQFVTDTTVAGTIRRVTVSVIRAGTDGVWETAAGSTTGLTFADLASATGTTLQQAYENGETIQLADAQGNLIIETDDTGTRADFILRNEAGTANYLATNSTSTRLDLGGASVGVNFIGTGAVTATGNPTFNFGTSQATFNGNVDALAGLDVQGNFTHGTTGSGDIDRPWDFSAGITNSAGEHLFSGGNLQLNDSIVATFGTGDDLSLTHNGTNSIITSATGDLIIDNTNVTGATIIRLGTNTSATKFAVQGDDGTDRFSITGATDSATFDVSVLFNSGVTIGNAGTDTLTINSKFLASQDLTWNDGGDVTLTMDQAAASTAGDSFFITAAQGGATGSPAGGNVNLNGGVGGGPNGNGGNVNINAGALAGAGVNGNLNIGNVVAANINFGVAATIVNFDGTTEATSTTAAGVVFDGGIGVAKDAYFGGDIVLTDATEGTITLPGRASGPATPAADAGVFYVEIVGGIGELFFKDDTGAATQITSAGGLNAGEITFTLDDAYNDGRTIAIDAGPIILNNASTTIALDLNPTSLTTVAAQFDVTYGAGAFTGIPTIFKGDWSGMTSLSNAADVPMFDLVGTTNAGAGDSIGIRLSGFDIAIEANDPIQLLDGITLIFGTDTDDTLTNSGTAFTWVHTTGLWLLDLGTGTDATIQLAGTGAGDLFTIEKSDGTDIITFGGDGIINVLTGSELDGNAGSTLDWNGAWSLDGSGTITGGWTNTGQVDFNTVAPDFNTGIDLDGGSININGGGNIIFGDSATPGTDDTLVFGAGTDLWIYSDGTHGVIAGGNAAANVNVRLTDAAGVREFGIYDSGNVRVAGIDSDGNADFGGTLTVAGATLLNGAVTLGDAAGDAITVTGTATIGTLTTWTAGGPKVNDSVPITIGTGTDVTVLWDDASGELRYAYATAVTLIQHTLGSGTTWRLEDSGTNGLVTVGPDGDTRFLEAGGNNADPDFQVDGYALFLGTLDVAGATLLNGAVTIGDAAADAVTIKGTATFDETTTFEHIVSKAGDTYDIGSLTLPFRYGMFGGGIVVTDVSTGGATSLAIRDTVMVDTAGDSLGKAGNGAAASFTAPLGVTTAAVSPSSKIPTAVQGVISLALGTGQTIVRGESVRYQSTGGGGTAGKVEKATGTLVGGTLVSGDYEQAVAVAIQTQATPGGNFLARLVDRAAVILI